MTLNLMSSLLTLTEHSPVRLQEELDLLGQTIVAILCLKEIFRGVKNRNKHFWTIWYRYTTTKNNGTIKMVNENT